jgi:hypothetical protein
MQDTEDIDCIFCSAVCHDVRRAGNHKLARAGASTKATYAWSICKQIDLPPDLGVKSKCSFRIIFGDIPDDFCQIQACERVPYDLHAVFFRPAICSMISSVSRMTSS